MLGVSKQGFQRLCMTAICACALLLTQACCCLRGSARPIPAHDGAKPFQPVAKPCNSQFYEPADVFAAEPAKQAYYDMMKAYGYPLPEVLKTESFWVCDFMQEDFEGLGMGGIFWMNAKGQYGEVGAKAYKGEFKDALYGYLGHDIYLLPGQVLPEHRHVGGAEGYGPKMEAWHVRHGSVEFFGEYKGEAGETLIRDMPESERPWGFGEDWFHSKYIVKRSAGEMYQLNDPESWHGQRAGPNGAIVSEYATYHNQVEFSKPGMEFASSGAAESSN